MFLLRRAFGVLLLLLGTALIVVAWNPSLMPPYRVDFKPPRTYQYYIVWPKRVPTTALGLVILGGGAWLIAFRRQAKNLPGDKTSPK